jgi:hypothetical protein
MGAFDQPEPFSDHFKESDVVVIEAMREGPAIMTDYGVGRPTLIKIDGTWYSIFGEGIENQLSRLEQGDLPRRVKLDRVPTKSGQTVKLFVPVEAE